MAIAKCGMRWSWDSLMWCSGKSDNGKKACKSCPWFIENKPVEEYFENYL